MTRPAMTGTMAAAFSLALIGCGRDEPARDAADVERTAFVAQPCLGLELGSEPLDPANARVFVEIAEVTSRALPQPIGRWLDTNAVKVRATANLVAFPDVPTSMPWGACVDAVCSSNKLSITLTSRLPERASLPLQLLLRIDEVAPGSAGDGAEGPRVLLDATLEVKNQEPFVLPPAPELSQGSIVVTAYLLRRHDDLHRVMECKVAQGAREQALPPSPEVIH